MHAYRFPLLLGTALLSACAAQAPSGPQPVVIDFALLANGHPARCGAPLGPLGADARPRPCAMRGSTCRTWR